MRNYYSSPEAELILIESEELIAVSINTDHAVTAPGLTEDGTYTF